MIDAKITEVRRTQISPWVALVERSVLWDADGTSPQVYHGLDIADYISVLAITEDGRIPLVRQYRPAVESITLEFPGGLAEAHEEPSVTAVRELHEETGLIAAGTPQLLGQLYPDYGRLGNRLWAFYMRDVKVDSAWQPEPGIENLYLSRADFTNAVLHGEFIHAPHVAMVGLALLKGLL